MYICVFVTSSTSYSLCKKLMDPWNIYTCVCVCTNQHIVTSQETWIFAILLWEPQITHFIQVSNVKFCENQFSRSQFFHMQRETNRWHGCKHASNGWNYRMNPTFDGSCSGGVVGSDLSSLLPSGVWRRRSSAACSARATWVIKKK